MDRGEVDLDAAHRPRPASELLGIHVSAGLQPFPAQAALSIHMPVQPPAPEDRAGGKRKPESDEHLAEMQSTRRASPPARGVVEVGAPPDVVRLAEFTRTMPLLRAEGIQELQPTSPELGNLRIVFDVSMDDMATIVVDRRSSDGTLDALATSGLSTCYAVAAIGPAAGDDDKVVMTLGHFSLLIPAAQAVAHVARAMTAKGVVDWTYSIAGGQASLYGNEAGMTPDGSPGSLDEGLRYVEAAGTRLRAARICLSETEAFDMVEEEGFRRAPSTGRPESVTVVFTPEGMMYYCRDGEYGSQVPGMPPEDEELS
ncbi:hypothetical protein [Ramlibacter sp.]|uniref:hypothetical protein n=1 Tax=Ramlibacter sp. TaxID=1917967 RepID=UPI002D7FAE90|nr:hypothetical protein [Ramlibacter sp.]